MDRVKRAAQQAQIAEFIESMPQGYLSSVGERGIRLSGGQQQRIGIARALYRNVEVIVFDEATSALDSATEAAIMTSLNDLSEEITIIEIAHRISTLKNCDRIIRIEDGKVAEEGPPGLILNN